VAARLAREHEEEPMAATLESTRHPVDEIMPAPKLAALGLQHVLVMYAGAVAVPLIIGRALKLPPEQVAFLINADLFVCGIVTLIQSYGIGPLLGIRLPVMMGVTFAAVGPMLAMANDATLGINGIFGAIIAGGAFAVLIAPLMSKLLPLFPPIVTGSIILMIGISLMRIGVNWAAGAAAPNLPGYGDPLHLGMALFVLIVILAITRFVKGFLSNVAVLCGIVVGCLVAFAIGKMHFGKVAEAAWFAIIPPFYFGLPTFEIVSVLTMCIVMIVVMIESVGMFLALSEMTGKPITEQEMSVGLRTDGVGTMLGGVFNTFPYTSFSQNVGLVGVTGVRTRWVTIAGGLILMTMGLMPKLGALVESVPLFVLGGAGIVMFGMVAATGVRILTNVDYKTNRYNLYIVALSLGFGMIPLVAPTFFGQMPKALGPLLHSGILLTAIAAVLLNLFFNGWTSSETARAEAKQTSKMAEAH
jgi:uric acid transporter